MLAYVLRVFARTKPPTSAVTAPSAAIPPPASPAPTPSIPILGRSGHKRIGIVAVTKEEWTAASLVFGPLENIVGTQYYTTPRWKDVVVFSCADRTNVPANEAVHAVIEQFRPQFLFSFGTAGGTNRDGVQVGDLVVARQVHYCAFKKLDAGETLFRTLPLDQPSVYLLECIAKPLIHESKWQQTIATKRPKGTTAMTEAGWKDRDLAVEIGEVLSGEVIMGSPNAAEQKAAIAQFDKALSIDTESFGVGRAAYSARLKPTYNTLYLVVRGISDNTQDPETNNEMRKQWTPYVAEAAARFIAALIDRLKEASP